MYENVVRHRIEAALALRDGSVSCLPTNFGKKFNI